MTETQFGSPLLTGLSLDKAQAISSRLKRRRIPAGTQFVEEGDKKGRVFWVLEGNVAVRWVWQGKTRLTAFIHPAPSLLGHLEAWKDEPALANLTAMDTLDVYEIERARFLELIQSHHQIAINVASYTGRTFVDSVRLQHLFLFGKADQIVSRCVLYLAKLYGKTDGETLVLDTFSTRTQIALLAGLSRRAVITILQDLEKRGLVVTEGRRLRLLNPKKMGTASLS